MIDLTEVLFAQRAIPRGDELFTHGSDVYSCLRATAYRRRGLTPRPLTQRELAKFAIGHGYEMEVASTLEAAGHDVLHDPEKFVVSAFGIDIIHPDILVRDVNLLVECKTTDAFTPFDKFGNLKPVSPHHAVQVSLGALAVAHETGLDVPAAKVLMKHAGVGPKGHIEHAWTVEPEEYRALIEERAHEVITQTGPDQPLPPAIPSDIPPYDECYYCRWSQCERNAAHDPERYVMEVPLA